MLYICVEYVFDSPLFFTSADPSFIGTKYWHATCVAHTLLHKMSNTHQGLMGVAGTFIIRHCLHLTREIVTDTSEGVLWKTVGKDW